MPLEVVYTLGLSRTKVHCRGFGVENIALGLGSNHLIFIMTVEKFWKINCFRLLHT